MSKETAEIQLVYREDVDRIIQIVIGSFDKSPLAEQIRQKLIPAISQIPIFEGALKTHQSKDLELYPAARRFFLVFETLIMRGLEKSVAADVAARVASLDAGKIA
jgi:hypothetical protein